MLNTISQSNAYNSNNRNYFLLLPNDVSMKWVITTLGPEEFKGYI